MKAYVQLDTSDPACRTWGLVGRYCGEILRCDSLDEGAKLWRGEECMRGWGNALDAIAWLDEQARDHKWVGYFSYDLGCAFEVLPSRAQDDLGTPIFAWARIAGETQAISQRGVEPRAQGFTSTFTREGYLQAVQRAMEYVAAGDVFQVNLSQRFSVKMREPAWEVYQRLARRTPGKYGGYLDFGDFTLLSNSPELFLKVEGRRVMTRPIKGTRKRAVGMEEELKDSEKDAAELNMIVDLERNDLGRVCKTGSVKVTQSRAIEMHPTVYHGVATVEGVLRDEVGLVDLLRATFPGGSVTGAPKIRAMEIIEELEPVRRGAYCGALGWIGPGGMELNVAIRTMVVKDKVAYVAVGGGIVADSVPIFEYAETLLKASAMMEALGAMEGLDDGNGM